MSKRYQPWRKATTSTGQQSKGETVQPVTQPTPPDKTRLAERLFSTLEFYARRQDGGKAQEMLSALYGQEVGR